MDIGDPALKIEHSTGSVDRNPNCFGADAIGDPYGIANLNDSNIGIAISLAERTHRKRVAVNRRPNQASFERKWSWLLNVVSISIK